MKIALLDIVNEQKNAAMNKDLAGGMGTYSHFGSSLPLKLLSFVKKRTIKLPILSFAFLQAILKRDGHEVSYIGDNDISAKYDLVLVYGSIVDFRHEATIAKKIKKKYPETKIGFFGSFPTVRPEIFEEADFVIKGEVESLFLYDSPKLEDINGIIEAKKILDLNDLPTPDFDNFLINSYSYFPAIKEKPFLVLQASRGCPYSCSYYCSYGMIQGPKYRTRSADKIVGDIIQLIEKYGVKALQFRDPTFGLDKKQVEELCRLLIDNKVKIKFGIETRLDLLEKEMLRLLQKAGLRNINVGIETINADIAELNKRKLTKMEHQEKIIDYCKKIGVHVSAFYIFGLQGDTEKSIRDSIKYAVRLNTNIAQFTILCPYPGTEYYSQLEKKNLIIEHDFEKFDSSNLVFKHDILSKDQVLRLRDYAFRRYYFRFGYLMNFLKWNIKES